MKCQPERENLKLNRATQLSNGSRGSKYSAHHSRLSVLLIPLSYLIPTELIIGALYFLFHQGHAVLT